MSGIIMLFGDVREILLPSSGFDSADDGRSISPNVAKNIMIQDMMNSENSMNTTDMN